MKKMLIFLPALLIFVGAGCVASTPSQPIIPDEPIVEEPQLPVENGDDEPIEEPIVSGECGIENCHSMEIVCGPNPAEVCTMMYMLGDKCRQFASCGIVQGECKPILSDEFATCKACVENCIAEHGDGIEVFNCESNC